MKITYFLRDDGGCGYYRLTLPMTALKYKKGHKVAQFNPGDNLDKLAECLDETDVLVIPRPVEANFVRLMEELKSRGVKVVVDHDDNMFKISPLSPHYEGFGVENVSFRMEDGTEKVIWKDGKNLKIAENKERIKYFQQAMEIADVVTVTQPVLASCYEPYNKNVKVLPNCIDVNLWNKLPLKPHDGIRMGWFGGFSHYEDWYLLNDVLPVVMKKYPELTLVILGHKFSGVLKDCPQDRIEAHSWVHTQAYPYKAAMLDLDFGLIPLVENEFNKCKSNIKWVEMASLEVPSVTSLVSPYKEWYDGKNGIFIENNDSEAWIEGISYMVENELARKEMGKQARGTVLEHFNIWDKCSLWEEAYS